MRIKKVNIINYKCFEGTFSLELNEGVNIIVGNNEEGKSTILEAIHLALTGILNGRYLRNELSQYLFNYHVVKEYLESLKTSAKLVPPKIVIEVFFDGVDCPQFIGNGNTQRVTECGVIFKIEFDEDYKGEYEALISSGEEITTLPIEYYKITWSSCAREAITARNIPIKSVLIDSTSNRYQNGSDIYISRIIQNDLEDNEKVELSQAYRNMKQSFMNDESVKTINEKIKNKTKITKRVLKISADLPTQTAWESALMTYLDDIPFHQIGKGEQCIIKTSLALGHQKSQEASLILIEEPENHLSHTKLNELMRRIQDNCADKQIIFTTHNSFVANKLSLNKIILLNDKKVKRLSDLPKDTYEFFKKLPGYPTLRLLLCNKAVLVEGDSDELIFQKAYMAVNNGKLPIEDCIDVIAVKLTFKRFLEIAKAINKQVAVITDNDGDYENNIIKKYKDFSSVDNIKVFADPRNDLNTLEPQFVDANKENKDDLQNLCEIIGIEYSKYDTTEKISKYMKNNKTDWALEIFESDKQVNYPKYIYDAVEWCNE